MSCVLYSIFLLKTSLKDQLQQLIKLKKKKSKPHKTHEVIRFEAQNAHLQMSVISVGTGSSLVSLGIMAKPPRAYRKPPMEITLRELRSCGNSVNSDHLEQNIAER